MAEDLATAPTAIKRTRSKTRRDDMLNEAARHLNAEGPSLTSLKDIASTLGVSRRALYHYIEDREDLVYQCYVRSCETVRARLDEARAGGGSTLEIIHRLMDLVLTPGQPELAAITEAGLLPEEKRLHVEALYADLISQLAALLQFGAGAGEIRICDFHVAANGILGLIFWVPLTNPWASGLPATTREEELANAKSLLAEGWASDRSHMPAYLPIDLAVVRAPSVEAFDRESLAEAKREKILATASRMFNRKGIDTTGLEEIAAELGATSRAIYHHVGDKQTLVAECYFRTMNIGSILQRAAYDRAQPQIASGAAFQEAWAMAQMQDDIAPLVPVTGFEAITQEALMRFRSMSSQLTKIAADHLNSGWKDGSYRNLDPRAMRLHTGISSWLSKGGVREPARQQQVAREIAAFVTLGIRALD